jgi:hypothetical protein
VTKPKQCAAGCPVGGDVWIPFGSGRAWVCWICAHQISFHEVAFKQAPEASCKCHPNSIYPEGSAARAASEKLRETLRTYESRSARKHAAGLEAPERLQPEPDRLGGVKTAVAGSGRY